MGRRLALPVLILFLVIAGFAGVSFYQESQVGSGPMTTAPTPQGPTRDIAFVSNAVEGSVSLIDLNGRAVIGTIDVTPDGKRVGFFRDPLQMIGQPIVERSGLNYAQDADVSPDGRVLYVSRGHLGDVAAFDVASGALMWRLAIGGFRADHMAISPDGKKLFVSALTANRVEVIDTASARRIGSFVTGTFPHDVHVSEDGARVYNASLGDARIEVTQRDNVGEATDRQGYAYQLTVADAQSLEILKRIRFSAGIRPFAVTRNETRLFAQLSNVHDVIAYDLEAERETARTTLPVKDGVTEADWDFEAPHHGLALSPDESTLCLAGRASDYAALVATDTLEPRAIIPVGDAPSWSVNSPQGDLCVLANNRSDDVSVISYADGREIARIPVGRAPKHIAVARVPETALARYRP